MRTTAATGDGPVQLVFTRTGHFSVSVEVPGFKKFLRENVVLEVSTIARIDATLSPGNARETFMVATESPLLQTERTEVAVTSEAKLFGNSRLRKELPGSSGSGRRRLSSIQNFTATEGPQGVTFFNANGQGNSANNTLVDGVDNTNHRLGLSIHLPSPEIVVQTALRITF